jgi:hypothetical protein
MTTNFLNRDYKMQSSKTKAYLKGPKREIFVAGIFTEIRPVWVGDLETRK